MVLSENLNKIIETLKATQRKSGATQGYNRRRYQNATLSYY